MKQLRLGCLLLACVTAGSVARAGYPVPRIEGVLLFVNQARSGVRLDVGGRELSVELGSASSVRLYEMGLAPDALRIGDEVCLWEKGRARIAIDNGSVGKVTSLAPVTLRVTSSQPWGIGTTALGDYARVQVLRLPTRRAKASPWTLRIAPPTREKVWTILKPERVEFTRLSQRALSDLAPGQRVSIYAAQIPPARLRSRGIAILQGQPSRQP